MAAGLTNTQIAERLFHSTNTVRAHLYSVYSKLDVSTRGAAIRFAADHGLI
jgi:DNA-binding CsgD family transcriptional regulator